MPALRVRPLAEADVDAAFAWYGAHSASLGLDFLRAVDTCFDAITDHPLGFPKVYRDVRRALVRRFPYAVFFIPDSARIEVIACVHTRQHPRRWRRRA